MITMHKKRDQQAWKSNEIKLDPDAIRVSNDQLQKSQRVEDSIEAYFQTANEVCLSYNGIHFQKLIKTENGFYPENLTWDAFKDFDENNQSESA